MVSGIILLLHVRLNRNCYLLTTPNRVDIDKRPPIVETKTRLGDWELDTIIGAEHNGVIVSMVERTSKLTKLVKVSHKSAKK